MISDVEEENIPISSIPKDNPEIISYGNRA
jgi:hypothetical protein